MATGEERARLSRETVVDGALALTDTEGLDGLTIRRLAQHLGVTPMALYWHFKNKEELLDGLADRLWSLVDTAVDPSAPWPSRLRTLMNSMVDVLRAHPYAASLMVTTQPEAAQHCFDIMEAALKVLADAGFTPAEGSMLCRHGLRTVTSMVIGDPGLKPQQTEEEAAEHLRRKRLSMETLSPSRYPCVIAAAGPLTKIDDPEAEFTFGVDLFVAGVEALAARR
ncbi:TetR family transcriptional regulator [Actinoallomurus iriomotensis]|uniref:TetR family transcriptional regulator n=1 Tax=Actinoallomurus iriomotensis TaxID=478107 RepID=A0A9W6SCC2_9ACTN|nr:TetR family transcriptional regulator [Actinoallomurus iriomotensis]GLY90988.1 TetR family transcriptional regulator [Actinoallomurus iriomotensis]